MLLIKVIRQITGVFASQLSSLSCRKLFNRIPYAQITVNRAKKDRSYLSPQYLNDKKISEGESNFVRLQVLGAGANDSPCSLAVIAAQWLCLFNCGEGIQRRAPESKVKMTKLKHIFITRKKWKMIGGLPGTSLMVQDSGVKSLTVSGPAGVDRMFSIMRNMVVMDKLNLKFEDSTTTFDFNNNVMSVKSVPLRKGSPVNDVSDCSLAVSYICHLKPRTQNADNNTILNGERPVCFLILDLPDTDFLPALEEFASECKKANATQKAKVALVVHFSEPLVLQHKTYQDFISEYFSDPTEHIYLHDEKRKFSGLLTTHEMQYQLNLVNAQIFPILHEAEESIKSQPNLCCFHMRPRKIRGDFHNEARLMPEKYVQKARNIPNFTSLLERLHNCYPKDLERLPAYPCITFLGTGSALPNKARNVSAILVQTTRTAYMLMDCGEGTYGQIMRLFGPHKTAEILRQLKIIYISHEHPDHHLGLNSFFEARRRLQLRNVLQLLLPPSMETWLNFCDEQIVPFKSTCQIILNDRLIKQPHFPPADSGIETILTCDVRHSVSSYGLCVNMFQKNNNGLPIKLTYSGDTTPCKELVELGKGSTILIHEATMEDDLAKDAELKTHSTFSQAIQQGREMNAEYIILTHFSQRYSKFPLLPGCGSDDNRQRAGDNFRNIAIAFDNMQVSITDLQHFHLIYPALSELFLDSTMHLEKQAVKRRHRAKRLTST